MPIRTCFNLQVNLGDRSVLLRSLGQCPRNIQTVEHLSIAVSHHGFDVIQRRMSQDGDRLLNTEPRDRERFIKAIHTKPVGVLSNDRRNRCQTVPVRIRLHHNQ